MLLSKLINGIEFKEILNFCETNIEKICFESSKVENNSIFIAIKGLKFDGHSYIEHCIDNGASVIICEELPANWLYHKKTTFLLCENSRKSLAEICHKFYGNPTKEINVIGITGTNGKTTCTFILNDILSNSGLKTAIIGTTGIYFNGIKIPATHTTPNPLELCELFLQIKEAGISHVLMEVSSHSLDQYRVHGIDFAGAIFTNLTHEHLDYHQTMINYANAKKMLFDYLDVGTVAIVNGDDEYCKYILKDCQSEKKFNTGRKSSNDYIIINEILNSENSKYTLNNSGTYFNLELKLNGKFNIDNASLCFAFSKEIGIMPEIIIETLKNTNGAPGRMQKKILGNGALALIDYAHTPDALEKALLACREIIKNSKINARLICVFGCGGDRDKTKRPKMGDISTSIADYSIITNDNPRTENPENIIEDIIAGIKSNNNKIQKDNYTVIMDRAEAIKSGALMCNEGDILLVAGKGHEDYQITGNEKIYFNDFLEINKY